MKNDYERMDAETISLCKSMACDVGIRPAQQQVRDDVAVDNGYVVYGVKILE